jgi:hypothetical protein
MKLMPGFYSAIRQSPDRGRRSMPQTAFPAGDLGTLNSPPPTELIAEIGEILAAGLMRVLARKSSQRSAEGGDSSLDISPGESGHRPIDDPEKL